MIDPAFRNISSSIPNADVFMGMLDPSSVTTPALQKEEAALPLWYSLFPSTKNEDIVPMLESFTTTKDGGFTNIKDPAGAVELLNRTLDDERKSEFVTYLEAQRKKGLLQNDFWNEISKLLKGNK
jgi:hypothetical protein